MWGTNRHGQPKRGEISGLCRSVVQTFALLGCCVAKTPERAVPQMIGFIGVAVVLCSRGTSLFENIIGLSELYLFVRTI